MASAPLPKSTKKAVPPQKSTTEPDKAASSPKSTTGTVSVLKSTNDPDKATSSPKSTADTVSPAKSTTESSKEAAPPKKTTDSASESSDASSTENSKDLNVKNEKKQEKKAPKLKRKTKAESVRQAASIIASELLDSNATGQNNTVKLDKNIEQSLRKLVYQRTKTSKYKQGTPSVGMRYDALIETLEVDPDIEKDPEKKKSLETLTVAKKNNKHLTLEELTQIFDACATIKFIDREQALVFVGRMKEKNTLTKDQFVKVMKEVESKMVNGMIPATYLRKIIEDCDKK